MPVLVAYLEFLSHSQRLPLTYDLDEKNNSPGDVVAQSRTCRKSGKAGRRPTHAVDDVRDMSDTEAKEAKYLPTLHSLTLLAVGVS